MVSAPTRVSLAPILSKFSPGRFRVQGWDPVLIISQTLHYLTMAFLVPILVNMFASPALLAYEGGPTAIGVILDWRQFTGRPTVSLPASVHVKNAQQHRPSLVMLSAAGALDQGVIRVLPKDSMRGWAVAAGWVITSLVDVFFLYTLVRRPTHILDYSCTLVFIHIILTTYYSDSFPWSLFYWITLTGATVAQVIIAEQWCVAREMREGFTVDSPMQMGTRRIAQTPRMPATSSNTPNPAATSQQPNGKQYERVPTRESQDFKAT